MAGQPADALSEHASSSSIRLPVQSILARLNLMSVWSVAAPPPPPPACMACAAVVVDAQWLTMPPPCGHTYCRDCLQTLCRTVAVLSQYPPRCCNVPVAVADARVASLLGAPLVAKLAGVAAELADPDRTYCAVPRCSAYLPSAPQPLARCAACGTTTCRLCKAAGRHSRCPSPHPDVAATVSLAEASEWQRCFCCRSLVERDWGCNHMTCRCGAQFCYSCGEKWPHCTETLLCTRALWQPPGLIVAARPPRQIVTVRTLPPPPPRPLRTLRVWAPAPVRPAAPTSMAGPMRALAARNLLPTGYGVGP